MKKLINSTRGMHEREGIIEEAARECKQGQASFFMPCQFFDKSRAQTTTYRGPPSVVLNSITATSPTVEVICDP